MSGAAEVAPHLGIADVVVDLTSTGSTLRVNGLREVATLLESSARLMARPDVPGPKAAALTGLQDALLSVVRARGKRYLMANVPRAALDQVREVLPGLNGPTVIELHGGGPLVAVHAVVAEASLYRTVGGAQGAGRRGHSGDAHREAAAMSALLRWTGRLDALDALALRALRTRAVEAGEGRLRQQTAAILEAVRTRGDEALRTLAQQLDGVALDSLEVPRARARRRSAAWRRPCARPSSVRCVT